MHFSVATKRLILRDFLADDWPYYAQYFKEPEAQKGILKIQSDDKLLRHNFEFGLQLAQQRYRRHHLLTIVQQESLQPIGSCSFLSAITHSHEAQIGWHLSASYSGQGLATEAASCLLSLGFATFLVDAIRADSFPENLASLRVMQKIGMKPIRSGPLLSWWRGYKYGEQRPIVRYQIRKHEWLEKIESV